MKCLFSAFLAAAATLALAQHGTTPADALKGIGFLEGDWTGKQNFNNPSAPLVADIAYHAHFVVGGRYLEEVSNTTLPGRKPTDVRHFVGYDPKTETYRAWWFNDTAAGPTEFEGKLDGTKLVLQTTAASKATLKATYELKSPTELAYKLEMKQGDNWTELFHSTYTHK